MDITWNVLVISGKVYVAWKGKMVHDVRYMTSLADTKHIFRERKIYLFMARRILHLAKTTRVSRDARVLRARWGYKLVSREKQYNQIYP